MVKTEEAVFSYDLTMIVDLIYISNSRYQILVTSSNNGEIRFYKHTNG